LSHSFSPAVHKALGDEQYRLIETDDPKAFIQNESFSAVNVTNPYKEQLIPFLSELDPIGQMTKSVNLILRREDKLWGYNTDYYGLEALCRKEGLDLSGKNIVILGNGGASKTVAVLAKNHNAARVVKLVRHKKEKDEFLFSEIDKVLQCDIIINTTPVGMFPDNDVVPLVPLEKFPHLSAVIDLIYNPLRTNLLLSAKQLNIPAYDGLYMLVAQAQRSQELSKNEKIPDELVEKIYFDLRKKASNIVLTGLPLSGKSLYTRLLSERYHKTAVDTDLMIEAECQMPISEIFRVNKEPFFRAREVEVIDRIYRLGNQVVSTGGGMIENPDIMQKLRQNGLVIFLDKDPEKIKTLHIENRPLIQSPEDISKLDARRRPLYTKYADIIIKIEKSKTDTLKEIEEKIDEYLSH
jgi:shikimate dehydrogenase